MVGLHARDGSTSRAFPAGNVTAVSTTKEPGVAAGWETEWAELDLSPTAAFTDEKVDFMQSLIPAPTSGGTSGSGDGMARVSRISRISRLERLL